MQPERELLQKWEARNVYGRFHPGLEIGTEGLVLGAGTLLAKAAADSRGRPHLAIDEPRVMAPIAAAYGKPVAPYVIARLRRAAELWVEGEKALAHIHLAHANLPPCGEDETLRLFLAEQCFSEGITPAELMKAHGYVSALLALLKYNPDQPRVPAGSGRESGEWTSGAGASEIQTPPSVTLAVSNNVQVAQSMKCSAFITQNCKGSIMREFPSKYLDLSVDQLLKDAQGGVQAAVKGKKLLFDNRFRK
ncbi:MAG: hypothetical protein ACREDH_14860 [Methylocella sp.]